MELDASSTSSSEMSSTDNPGFTTISDYEPNQVLVQRMRTCFEKKITEWISAPDHSPIQTKTFSPVGSQDNSVRRRLSLPKFLSPRKSSSHTTERLRRSASFEGPTSNQPPNSPRQIDPTTLQTGVSTPTFEAPENMWDALGREYNSSRTAQKELRSAFGTIQRKLGKKLAVRSIKATRKIIITTIQSIFDSIQNARTQNEKGNYPPLGPLVNSKIEFNGNLLVNLQKLVSTAQQSVVHNKKTVAKGYKWLLKYLSSLNAILTTQDDNPYGGLAKLKQLVDVLHAPTTAPLQLIKEKLFMPKLFPLMEKLASIDDFVDSDIVKRILPPCSVDAKWNLFIKGKLVYDIVLKPVSSEPAPCLKKLLPQIKGLLNCYYPKLQIVRDDAPLLISPFNGTVNYYKTVKKGKKVTSPESIQLRIYDFNDPQDPVAAFSLGLINTGEEKTAVRVTKVEFDKRLEVEKRKMLQRFLLQPFFYSNSNEEKEADISLSSSATL